MNQLDHHHHLHHQHLSTLHLSSQPFKKKFLWLILFLPHWTVAALWISQFSHLPVTRNTLHTTVSMLNIAYYYHSLHTDGNQPDENARMEGFMLFIWNIFFTISIILWYKRANEFRIKSLQGWNPRQNVQISMHIITQSSSLTKHCMKQS
jgi:hypothetical protein